MHGNEDEDAIDPEEDKAELVESCVSISNSINRNMIGTIPSTTPSTIASSVFAALLKKIAPASLTRGIPAKSFTKVAIVS